MVVRQREPVWAPFSPTAAAALAALGKEAHLLPMPGQASDTPGLPPADRHLLRVRWTGTAVALGATIGPDGVSVGFVFAATTITRNDGGDWLADGITVGDYIDIANAEDVANDGLAGPVTDVTAGVVTIASAAFTANADDTTVTFLRNTTLATLTGGETFVSGKWTLREDRNLVPGSIVLTVPGPFTVRDDGKGRLVALGATDERFDGLVNYVTGDWELNIAGFAVGAGDITAAYEHSCLYAPLDIEVEWDALMAQ
jgi:hypothetical protein